MMPLPLTRRPRPLRCEALEDRLTPSSAGDLDPTFNGTGINSTALEPNVEITSEAVAPDGKIIVAGGIGGTFGTVFVARFLSNGQLDPSFHGNGQLVSNVRFAGRADVAVQSDGTILVDDIEVGPPPPGQGIAGVPFAAHFVRISADGSTIEPNVFTGGEAGFALNPTTGDVYLADTFFAKTGDESTSQVQVTRLDKNLQLLGSTTVDVSGGRGNKTEGIALDSAGRVYVRSSFYDFSDQPMHFGLTRLGADLNKASVRTTSYALNGADNVSGFAVNSAGQVFVADNLVDSSGNFSGTAVWQFDSDLNKQAQTTLSSVSTFAGLHPVVIDSAGRVVVAGGALPYQSANQDFAVARLNPTDLSLDTSFNKTGVKTVDVGEGDFFRDAAVDQANNIVAVGSTVRGPTPSVIFRLIGSNTTPTGPVLVGGPLDGSAAPLTATNGSYQPGTAVSFFPGSAGNVRTAVADVNGDDVPDYIGGSGPGGGPRVAIIDGKTGARLADFFAFESSFTGGVFVAAADINGDGKADVVATPDQGGGPVVAVFDGAKLAAGQTADASQLTRFLGIADPAFRGGARPALGDVSGDGTPDLLVSAGFLGGPRVALYDGSTITGSTPVKLVPDFFAFEDSLRNGAFVTAGDVTGDGKADVAFGGGPGGAPRVRAFDGAKLLAAGSFGNLDAVASTAQVANFFAGNTSSRGGVRLAMRDADGDGTADLITGSGEGEPASVRVYKSATLLASATPSADQTLDPFNGATLAGGVFVG